MYELMGLSGQEYVDIYAASVKDGTAEDGDTEGSKPESSVAARIPETAVG